MILKFCRNTLLVVIFNILTLCKQPKLNAFDLIELLKIKAKLYLSILKTLFNCISKRLKVCPCIEQIKYGNYTKSVNQI